jgi:hypothetical protein
MAISIATSYSSRNRDVGPKCSIPLLPKHLEVSEDAIHRVGRPARAACRSLEIALGKDPLARNEACSGRGRAWC